LSDNSIKKTEYDFIKGELNGNLDYYKVDVNSNKTKALI